ncbi:signal peptidase I [Streptomyces sp. SID10815]|uniref:signal peptidase I n=1 Tax=Streptomyces sp. SID10815 TaxID=2706027 RepID=UPI001EF2370D|nr:signal peptidase I [Streptomyces sp. SID10815]
MSADGAARADGHADGPADGNTGGHPGGVNPAAGDRVRPRPLRLAARAVAVVVTLVVVGALAVFLLSVRVDGESMEPTLRDGDRLLAMPGSGGDVHRFDVVLMRTPGRDTVLVKRVIGLPGDRVAIETAPGGRRRVLLQEGGAGPWYRLIGPGPAKAVGVDACCGPDGRRSDRTTPRTVPAGRFFFLGDHADRSADSRTYGWARLADVSGRVSLRVWPLGAARGLGPGPRLEPVPDAPGAAPVQRAG